jgi:4-amino-4-deoxy-L-arabinose transferase-like glycosyltransferase
VIPSISNLNLPLDTIEALAWGSNLDWGFTKHPPFSAFLVNIIYFFFGATDTAYYFLSQVCVILSFFIVWKFSQDFFNNKIYPLLSILILEALVFFNYTTPEFNVYVCQLPLKAALIYFFWQGINSNKINYWILIGFLSALGVLTHYSFAILILSLFIYFIFFLKKNKKLLKNFFISLLIFFVTIFPHIIWLIDNNFETINYALKRSGLESKNLISHLLSPLSFIFKQIGMTIIFFLTLFTLITFKKFKKFNLKLMDRKLIFLLCINILPLLIILFISLLSGAKIRTMWMSTFYLFFGVMVFYFFKDLINVKKISNFLYTIFFLFFLSPVTYYYVSISNDFKRTDFPGKEISRLVQNKWNENFINEIKIVVGDEWFAGNLSYHLDNRPTWFNDLSDKANEIKKNYGVIYIGNPKVLKKICPGVYGTIKPTGYCMIGQK